MNANVRKQKKSGTAKRTEKPLLIVHLDDGKGLPLCGLPKPWPSPAHRLEQFAAAQDACQTCDWAQRNSRLMIGT